MVRVHYWRNIEVAILRGTTYYVKGTIDSKPFSINGPTLPGDTMPSLRAEVIQFIERGLGGGSIRDFPSLRGEKMVRPICYDQHH